MEVLLKDQVLSGYYWKSIDDATNTKRADWLITQNEEYGYIKLDHDVKYQDLVGGEVAVSHIEPEGHLDSLVRDLTGILRDKELRVICSTYKDSTLANRLENSCPASIESVRHSNKRPEEYLDGNLVECPSGVSCLRLVRHVVEHAESLVDELDRLVGSLRSHDMLLIELPDSRKLIERGTPCMLWECHRSYTTREQFRDVLLDAGAKIVKEWSYEYEEEDVQVVLAMRSTEKAPKRKCEDLEGVYKCRRYLEGLEARVALSANRVRELGRNYSLVMLGAGHNSINILHILGAVECLTGIVDDNRSIQGLYLPGTRLKIGCTSHTWESSREVYLMSSLKPLATRRVIDKKQWLEKLDGRFNSIFDF